MDATSTPAAFQFYPSDFLGDPAVGSMSLEERGAYISLLSASWMESGLHTDFDRWSRFLHISRPRFDHIWKALAPLFVSDGNGKLVNPRLEKVRRQQDEWREKSRKGGIASAKARANQRVKQ